MIGEPQVGAGKLQSRPRGAKAPGRLMLVGGHALFRQSLDFMLERERGLGAVAQVDTLADARKLFTEEIDAAVVDLPLPDGSGADLVRELRGANPRSVVLVLTEASDPESLGQDESSLAIKAGADEVLDKSVPVERIIAAVKRLVRR